MLEILRKNRNLILFEGIVFALLGMLAVALPIASTLATEMIIGWILLFSGCIQLYRIFKGDQRSSGFYLSIFNAILNIALGALLLIYPTAGVISLTLLLATFFILQGIIKIGLAFQLRDWPNWGWLIFSGLVSLAMAVLIFMGWPGTAFWVIGLLVGINMIFFGVALVVLALSLPKTDSNTNTDKKT